MKLPRTYFIPGLGADRRLFKGLRRQGWEFEVLEFMAPEKDETLESYGKRMAQRIDDSEPFLLGGVSLGGMVSMEACKHVRPEHVILISSVKNRRELPFYFKAFRYLPVQKALPAHWFKLIAPKNPFPMAADDRAILEGMRRDMDFEFVKWAVNAVVNWRNKEVPENLIHIHGTRDLMFPPVLLGEHTKLKKGSHVMVLDRAEDLYQMLLDELRMELE